LKLKNQVAIVTGAASGIGAAIAILFASEGARVVLVDIDTKGLQKTNEVIEKKGGRALIIQGDVTQTQEVQSAVKKILAKWKRIDILIPCSGISVGGTVATIDEQLWDKVFDLNVKGTYLFAHEVLPQMIKQKKGNIILIGSQLVFASGGNNAAYIASKGAIISLTKTMAVDHASQGIRVNALVPGVIDTAMSRRSLHRYPDPDDVRKKWARRHPMGRIGEAIEVARAALFLASDDSSFTTGSLLFVDGGWTAT
jgi:NAD(P)-dependent dehydrogenase (short-subunit alcohol dehydrogenase family)